MKKEISKKELYTSLFEYNGFLFIHQFYVKFDSLKALLFKWTTLANNKIFTNQEDKKVLKEEIKDEINQLIPVMDTNNAWLSFFLLNKALGSLIIIKTINNKLLEDMSYSIHNIWTKCTFYKEEYEKLKNVVNKTKEISKLRRKYERLMNYWREKKLTASTHQGTQKGLYTIVMEYNGDVFVYQFYLYPRENINKVLKLWIPALRDNKAFLEDEEDYVLLEQKIQKEIYQLMPVVGLVNIWSTYFMLKDGLGNVYVIKTDEKVDIKS